MCAARSAGRPGNERVRGQADSHLMRGLLVQNGGNVDDRVLRSEKRVMARGSSSNTHWQSLPLVNRRRGYRSRAAAGGTPIYQDRRRSDRKQASRSTGARVPAWCFFCQRLQQCCCRPPRGFKAAGADRGTGGAEVPARRGARARRCKAVRSGRSSHSCCQCSRAPPRAEHRRRVPSCGGGSDGGVRQDSSGRSSLLTAHGGQQL